MTTHPPPPLRVKILPTTSPRYIHIFPLLWPLNPHSYSVLEEGWDETEPGQVGQDVFRAPGNLNISDLIRRRKCIIYKYYVLTGGRTNMDRRTSEGTYVQNSFIYLYLLVCLFVCLDPIQVSTTEPFRSNLFYDPGKVYYWWKKNFKEKYLNILWRIKFEIFRAS